MQLEKNKGKHFKHDFPGKILIEENGTKHFVPCFSIEIKKNDCYLLKGSTQWKSELDTMCKVNFIPEISARDFHKNFKMLFVVIGNKQLFNHVFIFIMMSLFDACEYKYIKLNNKLTQLFSVNWLKFKWKSIHL